MRRCVSRCRRCVRGGHEQVAAARRLRHRLPGCSLPATRPPAPEVRLGDEADRSCGGGFRADGARRLITVGPPGSPQRTRTPGTRNRAARVLLGADLSVSTGSPDSGGLRRRAADGSTPGPAVTPVVAGHAGRGADAPVTVLARTRFTGSAAP
ncbi:hypothetical protein ACFV2N_30385 [Streptomyces sp. NPDC059680]|uniref:hypothetical protein n=1 Tax=Streptomyces sp. NPDC059680 TaxID=3346904 RepID=UPI00368B84CF